MAALRRRVEVSTPAACRTRQNVRHSDRATDYTIKMFIKQEHYLATVRPTEKNVRFTLKDLSTSELYL